MNKFKTLVLVLAGSSALLVTSCSKNNDDAKPEEVTLTTNTVADLDGSKGNVYYSLSTNAQVTGNDTASTKWDIKFSGTKILVNGGTSGTGTTQAQIIKNDFDGLTKAPETGFKTDADGASAIPTVDGWYLYTAETAPQHAILAVPGRIIVIKTSTGKYAKLEMKSYYKGNPDPTLPAFADLATRPASRYYTFQFTYQASGTTTLK